MVQVAPREEGGEERRGTVAAEPRRPGSAVRLPGVNGKSRKAGKGRSLSKGELEELQEALDAYEMTKGDWSKAR
jgi:hypothetical protein